jgi:hypothetical protein
MIVTHFAKVSALYPQVVISMLSERLENLPFAILYTSFSVWPRDHYMPLQRFTIGVCHALLQFPHKGPACIAKISQQRPPLATCGSQAKYRANPHSLEQDTLL